MTKLPATAIETLFVGGDKSPAARRAADAAPGPFRELLRPPAAVPAARPAERPAAESAPAPAAPADSSREESTPADDAPPAEAPQAEAAAAATPAATSNDDSPPRATADQEAAPANSSGDDEHDENAAEEAAALLLALPAVLAPMAAAEPTTEEAAAALEISAAGETQVAATEVQPQNAVADLAPQPALADNIGAAGPSEEPSPLLPTVQAELVVDDNGASSLALGGQDDASPGRRPVPAEQTAHDSSAGTSDAPATAVELTPEVTSVPATTPAPRAAGRREDAKSLPREVAASIDSAAAEQVAELPPAESPGSEAAAATPPESKPTAPLVDAAAPRPAGSPVAGAVPLAARLPESIVGPGGERAAASRAHDTDPARFLARVAKAFQAAQQRDGEVRLRLNPPELGALKIEIRVEQGVLRAHVEAETPRAQALLVDNLPALKERLAEQNIKIEQFDVDLLDRRQQQAGEERSKQPSSPPAGRTSPAPAAASEGASEMARHRGLPADGRLNVIV